MNELIGFIVLTGPLFLIVIFAVIALIAIIILMKKVTGTKKRWLGGLSVFGIAFFILFGDEIVGKMYLGYLCENKAEMKIYNTVELPAKYWNEDGSPKFINARGVLNAKMLDKRFEWQTKYSPYVNKFIRVEKISQLLRDKKHNIELGEKVTFVRYFGWLNNFSPAPNTSESCLNIFSNKYSLKNYDKMYTQEQLEFLLKIFSR